METGSYRFVKDSPKRVFQGPFEGLMGRTYVCRYIYVEMSRNMRGLES